jgi:hypothetical protein
MNLTTSIHVRRGTDGTPFLEVRSALGGVEPIYLFGKPEDDLPLAGECAKGEHEALIPGEPGLTSDLRLKHFRRAKPQHPQPFVQLLLKWAAFLIHRGSVSDADSRVNRETS